ncbi:hypothetical protein B0H14DRAFT_3156613 [Mycena olivaceomarginata]|nr:hypothetical protein B0H14DRAFT_3156613 [Mycena olivaceomarginata]
MAAVGTESSYFKLKPQTRKAVNGRLRESVYGWTRAVAVPSEKAQNSPRHGSITVFTAGVSVNTRHGCKPYAVQERMVGATRYSKRPVFDRPAHPGCGISLLRARRLAQEQRSKSNCMIVSYDGMQDSQRLGGLMHGRDTPGERVLPDLIMHNLAQLQLHPRTLSVFEVMREKQMTEAALKIQRERRRCMRSVIRTYAEDFSAVNSVAKHE